MLLSWEVFANAPHSSRSPGASIAAQPGQSPPGSASQPRKQRCRDGSVRLSIIFHVQRVLRSGGKAEGCGRKGCASKTRAVVMLSDSFQLRGHLPCRGCSRGRLHPTCSSPTERVPERAGGGVEQTRMHLHTGWDKPKAAGETSLGKHVLLPNDVTYASPQMGMRQFCWRGQAGAAGSLGQAALPATMFAGYRTGLALPGDRLLPCSEFVFSMAEPKDRLPAAMGAPRNAVGPGPGLLKTRPGARALRWQKSDGRASPRAVAVVRF